MDDVRAVMDAVGSERAALFGALRGRRMCLLFAATYPERDSALALLGDLREAPPERRTTRGRRRRRSGSEFDELEERGWGEIDLDQLAPSRADDRSSSGGWAPGCATARAPSSGRPARG